MGTEEKNSVIHRKAIGARSEFDARVMSPAKALRVSLAKVADQMFGLALTVTTVEQRVLAHADIRQEAGDDGLLLLLDGTGGARGAVKVDPQFLTALIEVQTMGAVRRAEADMRPVTRTDAAIVAPLMDAVLRRYDQQLLADDPEYREENYRFGDMIEDARTLSLALEAPQYDLYQLTLDVEDGAKTGILTLMLPHRKPEKPADRAGEVSGGGFASLEKNALEAQVTMDAVLTRVRLPLKEISALSVGMQIPLETGCLAKAELVASGGHVVARVRMGQMNGMRAVRVVVEAGTDAVPATDRPDTKPAARSEATAAAPVAAAGDDVLEGVAHPVEDSPAPGGADAHGASRKADAAAASEPDPDSAGDPSTADLMIAATSAAAPAQDQHEEA